MTPPLISEESSGSTLFPEYATLLDLVTREVEGLSDAQLDWQSDRWEWSKWSIRRQLGHMSSVFYYWLVQRWSDTLFPDKGPGEAVVTALANFDEDHAGPLHELLHALRHGIDLAQRVLAERNIGFLRRHTHVRTGSVTPRMMLMREAHLSGATRIDERTVVLTLEWTMRHIYFEEITHLYNIQRLKRAQGLSPAVEVPQVGYWVVDGWDRSEP